MRPLIQDERNYLRRVLTDRFNEDDLRTLCFDLNVDYENLPGEGKTGRARELVAFLGRRDRIPELIQMGKRQRPDIQWEIPFARARFWPGVRRLSRIQVVGALFALLAVFLLVFAIVQPQPSAADRFNYQVRVQSKNTGARIADARVSVEVDGIRLNGVTDSTGVVVLLVPTSYNSHRARLIVQATGYVMYELNIVLREGTEIILIQPTS